MKWLTVTAIPTAATLWNAVVPALYGAKNLDDRALLKAWKHALTARYMMQRCIAPRSERSNQRHMLHQCADAGNLKKIEAEVEKRGLLDLYGVEITVTGGKQ